MRVMPVLILNRAGEWLFDSVQQEWMNAILSTCLAMFGKDFRDPRPALAVLRQLERRLHQRADLIDEEAGVLVEALQVPGRRAFRARACSPRYRPGLARRS